ncbi:MAG: N-acetyltransferase [Acidobacteria bacterium]|nr:N-acetyltransferase [Acidobacteriota bacterium]
MKRRARSSTVSLGLQRDLDASFEAPAAAIPITVRPATVVEIATMLNVDDHGLNADELRERRLLLESGIPQAYVAVTDDGQPCYMQWLMTPADNDRIQHLFNGSFPRLGNDEALLECAYTPPAFRGLRIMPSAMAQIAERARDHGARWVLTFVVPDNVPSLKGCKRSGFVPRLLKHDGWRLFRRRITFERLPEGTLYPFDAKPSPASPAPLAIGARA